jgi:uracil-DNA glycosylase
LWQDYEELIVRFADKHEKIKVFICSAYEEPEEETISFDTDDEDEALSESDEDEDEEDSEENEYDVNDSFIATDDDEDIASFTDESGTFSEFNDSEIETSSDEDEGLDGAFVLSELTRALEKLKSLGVKTNLCTVCGKWEELDGKSKSGIIEGECQECRDALAESDTDGSGSDDGDSGLSELEDDDLEKGKSIDELLTSIGEKSSTKSGVSSKSKDKSEKSSKKSDSDSSEKSHSKKKSTLSSYVEKTLIPSLKKSKWASEFISAKDIIKPISQEIQDCEFNVFPPIESVFNAFTTGLCADPEKIKVVIIGQDPYHTKGAAMGLAFSCPTLQPSLKNIHKELKSDGFKVDSKSGDLTKWANQGVFLINTALTVIEGKANSHSKIWKDFTKRILTFLNTQEHLVVIMWGKEAQTLGKRHFSADKHKFIESVHPSPFSVNGKNADFFGSKPFSKANTYLKQWGVSEVDWNLA